MAFTPFVRVYLGIYPEGSKRALFFFTSESPQPSALRNPRNFPHYGIPPTFRTTG